MNYIALIPLIFLQAIFVFSCKETETAAQPLTEQQALQEIMQLQRKLAVADKRKDRKPYEKYLLEDYVVTLPNGRQIGKTDYLKAFENRDLQIASVEFQDLKVKLIGKDALITGKFIVDGNLGGQEIKGTFRGAGLFIKRGEEWFVAYEHLGPRILESESDEESQ